MAEKSRKLRRLNDFRNQLPHSTQSALVAFLREARKGDLPVASSSKDLRQARKLDSDVQTPYGPLLTEARKRCNHPTGAFAEPIILAV
jgi:hypothetical protein